MTPELNAALARIAALEREVAALRREVSTPKPQQITLPLDTASQLVLKDAMRQVGFTYP